MAEKYAMHYQYHGTSKEITIMEKKMKVMKEDMKHLEDDERQDRS